MDKLLAMFILSLVLVFCLTACGALAAGFRDGQAGTPLANPPMSTSPFDWTGYLIACAVGAAAREGGGHVVRMVKKPVVKRPVSP